MLGTADRRAPRRQRLSPLGVLSAVVCALVLFALLPVTSAPAAGPTVVSLTFNDGHASQYAYARPVLQAHGMTGTFYVASGWVTAGSNGSMSWAQARNLYRDGHEIGGMGTDHRNLTTLDPATQQSQVCGDRQTLTAQGVDPQTFAYPAAAVNAGAEAAVQGCGYLAGRTIGGLAAPTASSGVWAEPIPPADPYAVRTANVPAGAITLATLQAVVNKAAEKGGGWLPISFNQICHAGTTTYNACMASSKPIDDSVLSQFLDWLQNGAPAGTSVRTVRDVRNAPAPPPLPIDPTVVSLTFNDGAKSQYTYARPLLQAHHLTGTFYVASGWLDGNVSTSLAWWQADDLYRDGNEIGGMGVDHKNLTTLDEAAQQQQVCDDRQRLAHQGYDPQSFAYPTGAFNATAKTAVEGCGYRAARAAGGLSAAGPVFAETLPPKDPFAVRTVTTSSPITLAELQNAVTAAAANGGGWVPLAFNQVCLAGDANYTSCMASSRPIEEPVLAGFLTWLDGGGAPAGTAVKPVRDAVGAPAQPPLAARPTTVSLTFDDGLVTQYLVRAVLAAQGFHGTFYLNSGPADRGEAGTMTWAQMASLQSDGNDMGGHTRDHINIKTGVPDYDTKYHQVCDDRARLAEQGINAVSFAYPEAAFDATAEEVVRLCGYQTGRTGGSVLTTGPLYAETIPPRDPYATRALGTTYDGPITLASLQDAVSAASSHGGGWLQTLFHQICDPAASSYATCMAGYRPVDLPTLQAFVNWLADGAPSGVTVKSVAELLGVAPLVTVTSPVAGSTVGSGTPPLTGTADPAGGAVTVSIHSGLYPTATPVATLTASPQGGAWSATPTTALANGVYTVTAAQTQGGLTGRSVPRTFTIDSSAPTVTITAPADGSTVTRAAPTITGTAGSAADDSPTVSVAVHDGTDTAAPAVQTLTAPVTNGSWSIAPSSPLAAGQYSVVASQTTARGTVGTSAPVVFTVDLTGPTVTVTSPTDGQVVTSATLAVSGTASASSDVAVRIYSGSTTTGSPLQTLSATVAGGAWSATAAVLDDGTYTLIAEQRDTDGNTGSSAPVGFSVAKASPYTVTAVSPSALPQGASAQTLTVSGSGFTNAVSVSISGTGVGTTGTTFLTPTSLSVSVAVAAGAPTGTRDVSVSSPGQPAATCTGCLTVTAGPIDSTPPTVTSVTPADGSVGVGAWTDVTATFAEALDPTTVSSSTFVLRDSAGRAVPAQVSYDSVTTTTTLDPDTDLGSAGSYTATVTGGADGAKDAAGNALATDMVWSFTTAGPPTASFTTTPASGEAPLAVQFTDTSTSTPTAWAWNFGDGTTATTQNPAHTYTAVGTYTATLTATNATGPSTTPATASITVSKAPIRARSSTTVTGNAIDVPVPRPAGVATGDVLLAEITADLNPTMNTVPSGWSPVVAAPLTPGTSARVWVYYHVVGNVQVEPASYTWRLSAKQKWATVMTAFSGVDNATPFDTVESSIATTTAAAGLAVPGVSTVTPGAVLVSGLGLSATGTTATPPTGWTVAAQATSTQRTVVAYRLMAAPGPSGNVTWSLSKAATAGGWVRALRPAP